MAGIKHFAALTCFFTRKYAVVKKLRCPNVGTQKMCAITSGTTLTDRQFPVIIIAQCAQNVLDGWLRKEVIA